MESTRRTLSAFLTTLIVVGGLVFVPWGSTKADGLADTPWPMFRHNLNHTGLSPYDTSGNQGDLKWSFLTGLEVYSSPAIGFDGTIYVGSLDSELYAVNPDGSEKWSFLTGSLVESSPAIDSDGTIYVGSDDRKVYAINPDGSEKWSFTTSYYVHSSPAIGPDGTIYVGSHDQKLYAVNPDGSEKWNYPTSGHVYASPAIGSDGTIYVGSLDIDSTLYAINPDGSEKWNFPTGGGGMFSSPAIGSDGTIYVGSNDRRLYAINPDGSEKWSFLTGGYVHSSPAIGPDGTIYVGSLDAKLYAINPDGSEKWNFQTSSGYVSSSPAIGSEGTVYVGSADGKLYAINPDGSEKWKFATWSYVRSSPAIGSDGTVYVGSMDHKLYAIGPSNQPPVADFTWSPPLPYEGEEIQFLDNSTDPDGMIVSWKWTFEYLLPSNEINPARTYGDNGVYNVTLQIMDDFGATDNVTKQVPVENCCPEILEVNSTLHENRQRTHGYWKKQCDFNENNPPPSQSHVGIKQEHIDYIAQHSIVWSSLTTKDQVCENLTVGEQGGTMVQKLRMQLITVWLNIAAGFLFKDSPLDHPLTIAKSVSEFIDLAEDAILRKEDGNPYNDPTYNELQDLKNVTDDINNDAGSWHYTHPIVGEFEATVRDAGSDDLTLEWDFEGDGYIDTTVIYYNDPLVGPDPYPSPWGTYPFTVNDRHIVGYPTPPQPFQPRLYVSDDDGCLTPDEDPEEPWSVDWSFRYDVSSQVIEYGFTIYEVPVTYLAWDSSVTPREP